MTSATVNYVIASYPGKQCVSKRQLTTMGNISPENFLRVHLQSLLTIPNKITQVTLMQAKVSSPSTDVWSHYYDIEDLIGELNKKGVTVIIRSVRNYGVSYGQFIKALNEFGDSFDYTLLMEDDYIPVVPYFDQILVALYKDKFSRDKGVLCCWTADGLSVKKHLSHSLSILNSSTVKLVKKFFNESIFDGKGPYDCQMVFSEIFTNNGIPIADYSDIYHTPFWANNKCINCSLCEPLNDVALFVPAQTIKAQHKFVHKFVNDKFVNDKFASNRSIPITLLPSTLDLKSLPKHNLFKNKSVVKKTHR